MSKSNSRLTYGRRRSRSLGGILNAREVFKTIRRSLSSSQKLQLLIQYAVEHSFSTAEKNLCEDVDDDIFKKAISNCQINTESEIEEMNYCSLAVAEKKSKDANVSVDKKYEEYSSASAKLEEEIKQWDELISTYRDNLDKELSLEAMCFKGQLNLEKYQHLDYSAIRRDVESIDNQLNYQITKLKKTSSFFSKYAKSSRKGVLSWRQNSGNTFKKMFEDSPRRLIRKCCYDS